MRRSTAAPEDDGSPPLTTQRSTGEPEHDGRRSRTRLAVPARHAGAVRARRRPAVGSRSCGPPAARRSACRAARPASVNSHSIALARRRTRRRRARSASPAATRGPSRARRASGCVGCAGFARWPGTRNSAGIEKTRGSPRRAPTTRRSWTMRRTFDGSVPRRSATSGTVSHSPTRRSRASADAFTRPEYASGNYTPAIPARAFQVGFRGLPSHFVTPVTSGNFR